MSKLFLTTIIILYLPFAAALYGGETWTYHFDLCDEIRVNITATSEIHEGEYIMPDNCIKTGPDKYTCNCTDDYDFNISFKTNAVNEYTFDINYDYYEEEPTITITPSGSGSSGGSSGYSSSWNCSNWSECINNKEKRVCIKGTNQNINYTQSRKCMSETKDPEKKKEKETKAKGETEIIGDIIAVINNETQDEKEYILVDAPTKEEETYIYFGIILITIIFIIIGWFILNKKSSSES